MKLKTINGHYDLVFSLAHNNRDFIPNNVDVSRTPWNYNCIVAGGSVYMDIDDPRFIPDFWERYRENSEIYWLDRAPAKQLEYERFQRELQWIRRHRMQWRKESHGLYGLFLTLPMLPLIIVDEVYWDKRYADAVTQRKAFKWEQSLRADNFKMQKSSFREALRDYDLRKGTKLLYYMDDLATEMAAYAGDTVNASEKHQPPSTREPRFATIEEIYAKLYEPAFRGFQNKQ